MNSPNSQPPVAFEPIPTLSHKLHWPWFTLALLLPAVVTFATATAGLKDAPVACAFLGAGFSGLVCGILLGRRLGKTTGLAIVLSVVLVCIFAVLSFALCFGGCMAGNYQVNIH